MRNRNAFFSLAFAATAVLLAGAVASAGGGKGRHGRTNVPTPPPPPPPMSCSAAGFDVQVSSGPTFVACDAPGGQCTEIEYAVVSRDHHSWKKKKKPSHVFMLQGVGVWDVEPQGSLWYAPCEGIPGEHDPGFGQSACHEQAIKINTRKGVTQFKIVLAGLRRPSPTSVAIQGAADDHHRWKHGNDDNRVSACTILGLGLEAGPNPDQITLRTDTIDFKGCEVEFTRDPKTGEVVEARLLTSASDSGEPCQSPTLDEERRIIEPLAAGEVEVFVGNFNLGDGKFGDGYVSTGTESCTTRVIGGRVYTWGAPCP